MFLTPSFLNSLTGKTELLKTREPGKVSMYVCGVTVYDDCHLGHARSQIVFDTVNRMLLTLGYEVRYVRNITDIDDKIIKKANDSGKTIGEITSTYIDSFHSDMKRLGVLSPSVEPRATLYLDHMISLIQTLLEKGHAYTKGGSVYFRVKSYPAYGELSHQQISELRSGARVESDEEKEDPLDFALWKGIKEGEPYYEAPFGPGRPGWHIECSAMSMKYLGRTLDIHGGGEDLIFPHHENEIQQSEAFTGVTFSRYWMHGGMLNVTGEKMSKSLHNFMSVEEALKLHPPETLRLLFANSLYRRQMEFSPELLAESDKARERLEGYIQHLLSVQAQGDGGSEIASLIREDFVRAMDDDFNTRDAVASLFNNLREARKLADGALLSSAAAEAVIAAAREVNGVLRIIRETAFHKQSIGKDIEELISKREEARRQRRFDDADAIRRELSARGIILEDTESGVRWKRK